MRTEFIIVGLILIALGIGIGIYGYNQILPSKAEKFVEGLGELAEGLTGEKMPPIPKRDTTYGKIMIGAGGILFLIGLVFLLKSGQSRSYAPTQSREIFCHKCGTKLSTYHKFCPNCGTKI